MVSETYVKSHITSLDEISVELTDGPMVLIFRTLFLGPLLGQRFPKGCSFVKVFILQVYLWEWKDGSYISGS